MTGHTIRVAILDDDPGIRSAFSRLLRTANMVVDPYETSSQFFESLLIRRPDCLVLDLQMPEMTGVEVLEYLKRSHICIPTIVLTAHDTTGSREACLSAGAIAYLHKPLGTSELIATIESNCRSHPAETLPSFT